MNEIETLYNRQGRAVAYINTDGIHVYLYGGKPAGYIHHDCLYAYSGEFMAWFSDGWVRDIHGAGVFFTRHATGGPLKPLKQLRPLRGLRSIRPIKNVRQLRPLRSIRRLAWSEWSDESFFETYPIR